MSNLYDIAGQILLEVKKAVTGKDDCIIKAFAAILAGGHILIEDVPGVGKTTLAVAFSRVLSLENHRIQFTPDVMPSDILGFQMYDKETGAFTYHPGAVLCNLFLADEINRTSPKTQSSLLQVMEEGFINVDGVNHALPKPFVVIATENPKGSAGTFLLPESQLDRFMISMSMGYPDLTSEILILKGDGRKRTDSLRPVATAEQLLELQTAVSTVYIHDDLYEYLVNLSRATRENSLVELGLSPRGTIALAQVSKAIAFLDGRDYVTPEDIRCIFPEVASHRLVLNARARASRVTVSDILEEILKETETPTIHKNWSTRRDLY